MSIFIYKVFCARKGLPWRFSIYQLWFRVVLKPNLVCLVFGRHAFDLSIFKLAQTRIKRDLQL